MKKKMNVFKKGLFPSRKILSFVGLIIVLFVMFAILEPNYATGQNIYSMILSTMLSAVLALSMGIVISSGNFDLSIGHIAGFSSLMCGFFLRDIGLNTYVAVLLAIFLGVLIGVINGIIVSRFGISSFIATLSMQFVLVGVRQWITQGDSFRANKIIKSFSRGEVAGISNLIIISLVIIIIVSFVMQKTSFGRKMQFVGSNITASMYIGINVKRYTFLAFVLSGLISGVVGILQFSKLTSATINIGDGWLFPAMTIAVFSIVMFNRFKGYGIVLVALLVTMITTGINMLGVSAAWTNFVLGFILLVAILASRAPDFARPGR